MKAYVVSEAPDPGKKVCSILLLTIHLARKTTSRAERVNAGGGAYRFLTSILGRFATQNALEHL